VPPGETGAAAGLFMENSPPLLEIRNLRTWYPVRRGVLARTVDYVRAVDGVDLTIRPGETLGVVGESGCGKSTLARTILRLERPRSGEILLDGRDVLHRRGAALQAYRRAVQVVFQDPLASLNPRHTILDQVTEGVLAHGRITPDHQHAFAQRLLRDVGLDANALDRYPHAFSGGQRQRICIARALALAPRLLICDEAVSALDLSVRAQILNLLAELRTRHQLSYLFITHDLGVVQHLADRIAVMYLGRIVELGPATQVLEAPAHPYTRLLLTSVPQIGRRLATGGATGGEVPAARPTGVPAAPRERIEFAAACPFAPRCPHRMPRCLAGRPELTPAPDGCAEHQAACFALPGAAGANPAVLIM
jgi:oligopeptide/dipeptide ABC transporter ATP-binding protein